MILASIIITVDRAGEFVHRLITAEYLRLRPAETRPYRCMS
jgi:hypothetical protein